MLRLNLTKERVLSAFVNQMIADKGLAQLGQPEKTKLKAQLLDELNSQIEKAYLRAMSDEDLIRLNEMLDNDASDEEIGALIDDAVSDQAGVAAQTMQAFRSGFLKEVA